MKRRLSFACHVTVRYVACLLLVCAVAWAALPVSDSFTKTGPNVDLEVYNSCWVPIGTSNWRVIASSDVAEPNSSGVNSWYFWNCDTFNADQFAENSVPTISSSTYVGPAVRLADNTGADGYRCACNNAQKVIQRYNSGSETTLVTDSGSGCAVSDVLHCEATGTGATVTVTFKVNGANISGSPYADSSASRITAAGHAGMSAFSATNSQLDDFLADNVAAPSAKPRRRPAVKIE